MKNIKRISILILLNLLLTSCGGSDVIVKIYGAFEYNCTKDEFRTLSENPMLPHLKKNLSAQSKSFITPIKKEL